jgi:hypothetical protein
VNAFGCFGDAIGSAVGLSTIPQILLDGANGVSQAPRLCATLEPGLVTAFAAMLVAAMVGWRAAGWPHPRLRMVVVAILIASYAPGWIHTLVLRADRPAAQNILTRDVAAARVSYERVMRDVLATTPATTCFGLSVDSSCAPFGGIDMGAAENLLPHRRCVGGETSAVSVEVSACSSSGVRARIGP